MCKDSVPCTPDDSDAGEAGGENPTTAKVKTAIIAAILKKLLVGADVDQERKDALDSEGATVLKKIESLVIMKNLLELREKIGTIMKARAERKKTGKSLSDAEDIKEVATLQDMLDEANDLFESLQAKIPWKREGITVDEIFNVLKKVKAHKDLNDRVNAAHGREKLAMTTPKDPNAVADAVMTLMQAKRDLDGTWDSSEEIFRRVLLENEVLKSSDVVKRLGRVVDDNNGVAVYLADGRIIEFSVIPAENGRAILYGAVTKEKSPA